MVITHDSIDRFINIGGGFIELPVVAPKDMCKSVEDAVFLHIKCN